MNTWIRTAHGRKFDFAKFSPADIHIDDIAHALALQCRYNGQCSVFYSVAEHSSFVASMVPPEARLEALLHDAAEAYLGDVVSPLKALLPDYRMYEARVDLAIRTRFDLPWEAHPAVTVADRTALDLEMRDLFPDRSGETRKGSFGISPEAARSGFLKDFFEYGGGGQ